MPFQVSPGVNVSEIDLTTVIPAVSTSVGAFAGRFRWGPALTSVLITSEDELYKTFGKPTTNNAVDFFTAANFLSYTSALKVVRAINAGSFNAQEIAPAAADGVQIPNDDYWNGAMLQAGSADVLLANTFYAKYPGIVGNEIKVELCDTAGDATGLAGGFKSWWPNTFFAEAPGTSEYASNRGSANDEVHIAIFNKTVGGAFSPSANGVLELYPFLSKASDAKDASGESSYFKDVINRKSSYIRIGSPTAATNTSYGLAARDATQFGNTSTGMFGATLSGGTDVPSDTGFLAVADYQKAWDLFKDADQEDVSLLVAGAGADQGDTTAHSETGVGYIIDIASTRKDCVAFVSPSKDDVVDKTTDASKLSALTAVGTGFRTAKVNKNTSYAFLDSGWKYQYDKYNAVYRWIPLNGDVAGLTARTDQSRDPWWSPAGYNRGQIKNVVKLAYNPSQAHRDALYQKQINPVVSFPGQGTLLFGDKTMQTRPSAFDRLNVRRLFIVLEKAISTAAKFSLFEFNDTFTRSQFRNMVEPFLRDVQGRRGVTDFKVVCDETNNPGSVVDRNEFVGDIYIKPSRSINYIQLNFVAVATGVDFSEVVGKF